MRSTVRMTQQHYRTQSAPHKAQDAPDDLMPCYRPRYRAEIERTLGTKALDILSVDLDGCCILESLGETPGGNKPVVLQNPHCS